MRRNKNTSCRSFRQSQQGGAVRTSYVGHYPDGKTGFNWLDTVRITGIPQLPQAPLIGGKNKKPRASKRSKRNRTKTRSKTRTKTRSKTRTKSRKAIK